MADDETTQENAPETPVEESSASTAEQAVEAPVEPAAQTPAEAAEEAPAEAAEEAPAEAAEAPAEAAEAPAKAAEAPAEAAEAPAEAAEARAPDAPAPPAPEEILHPKDRRRRSRSAHTGEARPPLSAEERQAARLASRAEKAKARRVGRPKERAKAKQRRAAASASQPAAIAHEHGPGRPKTRQGIVVSDKGEKTIRVRVDTSSRHRRYKKIVRSSSTLHVHDERNEAGEGDLVRVVETRPLSRTKRWRLTDVLDRAR